MIRIIADGLAGIRRSLLRFVPDLSAEVTRETAGQLLAGAQRSADKHTKTGALVRSLKLRRLANGQREVYHDLHEAPHALFVHWGTRPHVIRPKNKRVLRWVNGGEFIFAKVVHHPGYKGDPYLVNARTAISRRFSQIARDSFNSVRRRVFG